MELIDITVPIRDGMFVYDGDPTVTLTRVKSIADGQVANISRLDFGVHSGTHVDAPLHFIEGGAAAEQLPLEPLIGPVHVVDATSVPKDMDRAALEALDLPDGAERILFKTPNSRLWEKDHFSEEFCHLTGSGAQVLLDRGVKLVGLDYLSVGDPAAHRLLLGAGVVAMEGLDLRNVEPAEYRLVALPLKIVGSDGAPTRAVLIKE